MVAKANRKPQPPVCNGVRMPRKAQSTWAQLGQRHEDEMNARIADNYAFNAATDERDPMEGWG